MQWILDSRNWDSGFLVRRTWIPNPSRKWDSEFLELYSGLHKKNFLDSAFHEQIYPEFQYPDSLARGEKLLAFASNAMLDRLDGAKNRSNILYYFSSTVKRVRLRVSKLKVEINLMHVL